MTNDIIDIIGQVIFITGIINPSSAGIGRTGVFMAVDIGLQHIDRTGGVDIPSILSAIILDRGGLIQSGVQYVYVYQVKEREGREGGGRREERGRIDDTVRGAVCICVSGEREGREGWGGLIQSEVSVEFIDQAKVYKCHSN